MEWYDAPEAIKYACFDEDIPKELDIMRKVSILCTIHT